MDVKYVVMVQCEIAHRRCSGFGCTNAFYKKEDKFQGYNNNIPYISFACGGCCGKGISAKLEHFSKRLRSNTKIRKDEVSIHLSSCMTTDNYHYDRCPHLEYIKKIIVKKGYKNIVENTCVSETSKKKRERGVYQCYEEK